MNKAVLGVYPSPKAHWVGDGFPVRSLFSYDQLGRHISPFLLLDYAAPTVFAPAARPRGVGEHPHRGFETVTIVYQGEVAHRDSAGNSGVIGPGDVQWMTAAVGDACMMSFTRPLSCDAAARWKWRSSGSTCPPSTKCRRLAIKVFSARKYRRWHCRGAGTLRVIAGNYAGQQGPGGHLQRTRTSGTCGCGAGNGYHPVSYPRTTARRLPCCAAPSA